MEPLLQREGYPVHAAFVEGVMGQCFGLLPVAECGTVHVRSIFRDAVIAAIWGDDRDAVFCGKAFDGQSFRGIIACDQHRRPL